MATLPAAKMFDQFYYLGLNWVNAYALNTPGGIIKDWAYENSGLPTSAGNVLQTAPVEGVSSVFLSGESGQDSTLGPLLNNLGSGVSLSLLHSMPTPVVRARP